MAMLIEGDLKVIAGIIKAISKANCGLLGITVEGKLEVYDNGEIAGYIQVCPNDNELVFFNPQVEVQHDAT